MVLAWSRPVLLSSSVHATKSGLTKWLRFQALSSRTAGLNRCEGI